MILRLLIRKQSENIINVLLFKIYICIYIYIIRRAERERENLLLSLLFPHIPAVAESEPGQNQETGAQFGSSKCVAATQIPKLSSAAFCKVN